MGIFGWSLPPGCGTLPDEESVALELNIDGTWYAWDDADRVYKYDPSHPLAREDGYVPYGKLAWPDVPADTEVDVVALVREFVKKWEARKGV